MISKPFLLDISKANESQTKSRSKIERMSSFRIKLIRLSIYPESSQHKYDIEMLKRINIYIMDITPHYLIKGKLSPPRGVIPKESYH